MYIQLSRTHWPSNYLLGLDQLVRMVSRYFFLFKCLHGRMVTTLVCHAEIAGLISRPGEIFVRSRYIFLSWVCLCVYQWHSQHRVSLVRGYELGRYLLLLFTGGRFFLRRFDLHRYHFPAYFYHKAVQLCFRLKTKGEPTRSRAQVTSVLMRARCILMVSQPDCEAGDWGQIFMWWIRVY